MTDRLGVLTGLQAEAKLARPLGLVRAGGGTSAGAAAALRALVAAGADSLLSFGLAGGLNPDLPAGSLVVPCAVLVAGRRIACDPALLDWLGGPTLDLLLATPDILPDPAAKRAAWAASGAAAADMESGVVAASTLPFAVLRVVCDPADRQLPPAALAALDARGGIALWPILRSLLRQPGQIPDLLRLAADAAAARRQLAAHLSGLARVAG